MMSNEAFALLTPVVILAAVAGAGGLFYWDIVRRHPVQSTKTRRVDGSRASAGTQAEIFEDDEPDQRMALRLQENAASTARIVREANQLASSVERFTKAISSAKPQS
jgi:hypothetical protein